MVADGSAATYAALPINKNNSALIGSPPQADGSTGAPAAYYTPGGSARAARHQDNAHCRDTGTGSWRETAKAQRYSRKPCSRRWLSPSHLLAGESWVSSPAESPALRRRGMTAAARRPIP